MLPAISSHPKKHRHRKDTVTLRANYALHKKAYYAVDLGIISLTLMMLVANFVQYKMM